MIGSQEEYIIIKRSANQLARLGKGWRREMENKEKVLILPIILCPDFHETTPNNASPEAPEWCKLMKNEILSSFKLIADSGWKCCGVITKGTQ